jgi:hypothetical protein
MECEGLCSIHQGEIRKVNVIDSDGFNWGYFNYCDKAIEIDRENGFTVIDISPESLDKTKK